MDASKKMQDYDRIGAEEESDDLRLPSDLLEIARRVKGLDDLEPPAHLLPSVMETVRKSRIPWYSRFYRWLRSPRSVSFVPLHLAVASILLVFFVAVMLFKFPTGKDHDLVANKKMPGAAVVFTLNIPNAHSVALVGSFNEWRPDGFQMKRVPGKPGVWALTLWLPQGRYEYAFLVDGEKVIADPQASLYQDDGFGQQNSVLILGNQNGEAI